MGAEAGSSKLTSVATNGSSSPLHPPFTLASRDQGAQTRSGTSNPNRTASNPEIIAPVGKDELRFAAPTALSRSWFGYRLFSLSARLQPS